MRKRETSPYRAPCHRDRMDPAAAGVVVVVGVDDVVGGGGGGVGGVAEVAGAGVVASEPGGSLAGMSQTWGWVSERKSCSDRVGLDQPERTGRRRRRGIPQSGLRGRGDPGG